MQASLLDWQPSDSPVARLYLPPPKALRRPRAYQLEALHGGGTYVDKDGAVQTYPGALAALEAHRSAVLVMATGLGKSFVAGQVCLHRPGRTLVLVHTDPLADQFRKDLIDSTGRPWQLEKAEFYAVPEGGIDVVASVQTLGQWPRLQRWQPDAFQTVIVDEGHHYVGEFFRRPIDYFKSAKVLLLTATPNRTDGVALGTVAEVVAYRKDLGAAVDEGWSTPVRWEPLGASADVSKVGLDKFGELKIGELDDAIARQIAPVCKAAIEKCGDRRTIIFLPGVKAAKACADTLNLLRPGSARYVSGEMDQALARQIMAEHKRGDFPYLANCNKLTEGYDDPGVTEMIDAARTKSLLRTIQKVGRIARLGDAAIGDIEDQAGRKAAIAACWKPRATWWDLVYNGSKITDLSGPVDVLGGAYTKQERARAKKILEKQRGGDITEALVAARAHEQRLAVLRARAAAKAAERVKLRELGGGDPTKRRRRAPAPPKADPRTAPPTEKQAARLRLWGVPVPATQAEASKAISKEVISREKGWCDYRQREWLGRYGINAWAMPVWKGKKLSAAIVANGKQRLTDEQYRAALARDDAGADG